MLQNFLRTVKGIPVRELIVSVKAKTFRCIEFFPTAVPLLSTSIFTLHKGDISQCSQTHFMAVAREWYKDKAIEPPLSLRFIKNQAGTIIIFTSSWVL